MNYIQHAFLINKQQVFYYLFRLKKRSNICLLYLFVTPTKIQVLKYIDFNRLVLIALFDKVDMITSVVLR